MVQLGVNIDHVATIRQARRTWEPDPVWAAVEAQLGGADVITVHLREDRRHIHDDDVRRLEDTVQVRLNLEMAATDEMVAFAGRSRAHMATLVPEGRREITTEGGLDVAAQRKPLREVVTRLRDGGLRVSAFIDPVAEQVEAACACGFDACEIHTGPYANTFYESGRSAGDPGVRARLDDVCRAGAAARRAGMQFNAGHALTYANVAPVAALPELAELHIGHSIVCRAVFTGLRAAVAEMKRLIREATRPAASGT